VVSRNEKDTWPVKAAVVITHANQNVGMVLKELLRNFHWTVVQTTSSVDLAIEFVHQANATMIIVDDSNDCPAPCILRHLLWDPITAITPTLSFVSNTNRADHAAIANLGRPLIVEKPLTPNRFIPGFRTLIKVWSAGYYLAVRQAITSIVSGDEELGMRILTKLAANAKARVLIAPTISHYCRKSGNIKTAEKVLLLALKTMPRNLGLILSLADLYMHTAMPHMAARLIAGATATYGNSVSLFADGMQAQLMMQNFDGAAKLLQDILEKNHFPTEYHSYLSRLYFTEGRMAEFNKTIASSQKAEKFMAVWNTSTGGPKANNVDGDDVIDEVGSGTHEAKAS